MSSDWYKWRLTYRGGSAFIQQYLQKYSVREDDGDFTRRKKTTYNPAFAKEGVTEIKNSIYSRMAEITRTGGSKSYSEAVDGLNGGVDNCGSTMNNFIGQKVLPELITMARVGVFVDKPQLKGYTVAENLNNRPYLYYYCAEDIRSWTCNDKNEFTSVLLVDHVDVYDDDTLLPTGTTNELRWMYVNREGTVTVEFFDDMGYRIENRPKIILDLPIIPFAVAELPVSMLEDIADYQIALLNLASSNLNYALQSNFPFYTEQYDPRSDNPYVKTAAFQDETVCPPSEGPAEGSIASTQQSTQREIKVGTTSGRRYPRGTNQPAFIHPSPEPLTASLALGQDMKAELRQLLSLSMSTLVSQYASASSKQMDQIGLEGGLSCIGFELETLERNVGRIWSLFERAKEPTVKYPERYQLKSEEERQAELKELKETLPTVPSTAGKKEILKRIVTCLIGHKITFEKLQIIHKEIDKAEYITSDAEDIKIDVELGLVDLETASIARGYNGKGVVEKAKIEHAERAARIIKAQSDSAASARGVKDLSQNQDGSKLEKQTAGEPSLNGAGS